MSKRSTTNDGRPNRLQRLLGAIGLGIIHSYLHLFGRTVRKSDLPWLLGPVGPALNPVSGPRDDRPYERFAERERLTLDAASGDAGLLADFDVLAGPGFDVTKADPLVRRFYERTSRFELDVWSETRFPGRFFLWLIVYTVSRVMNQLNFPIFGLETSRGMTSEVLPLRDASGRVAHTGWQRRIVSSGLVIYTGFYSTVRPPARPSPCVKVVFPVPRGNATVLLRPEYSAEGRFRLLSAGEGFGDVGFYRVLELDAERLKVRYLKTLRERFEVYTDEEGIPRCDHEVRFLGIVMLRLHYRMRERERGEAALPDSRSPGPS